MYGTPLRSLIGFNIDSIPLPEYHYAVSIMMTDDYYLHVASYKKWSGRTACYALELFFSGSRSDVSSRQ